MSENAISRQMVDNDSPLANLLNDDRFVQIQKAAKCIAASSLIPDHLCMVGPANNKQPLPPEKVMANCVRILNQAHRWNVDPYALLDSTYVVGGKLGYEGKLVAAIVNKFAGLKNRLSITYNDGKGDNLEATVSGTFEGEDKPRTVTVRLGDVRTNNQMWTKDPKQKIWYTAATKWARLHCPEVLLGIVTTEDLEQIEQVEPPRIAQVVPQDADPSQSLLSKAKAKKAAQQPQDDEVVDAEYETQPDTTSEPVEAESVQEPEPEPEQSEPQLESKPVHELERFTGEPIKAWANRAKSAILAAKDFDELAGIMDVAERMQENGDLDDTQLGKVSDMINARQVQLG